MILYNTLTREKETFIPNEEGKVKMYTCGPTVYHYAHIGNLRSYIMEDVLLRELRYEGYEVKRVMNITDVGHLSSDADTGEDKMVKGALREHKSVMEIAKFYTDAFFEDFKKLNNIYPEVVEPATNCIDDFIKVVSVLLEKGHAYIAGGNVYFDTSTLENYYALTPHKEDDLRVGVRDDVEADENKKNPADFVLWFTKSKFEDQQLKWDSPWGVGYPGWHIECSCISMKHLGENLDIHCGGVDNIFPHHTNEIAQSEAYLGHKWCNYWFHVQHLNDRNGKMSKSEGNILTVSTLEEKGYLPLVYRFYCLQSHYRKPLEFTFENLDNTKAIYEKLTSRVAELAKQVTPDQVVDSSLLDENKRKFINVVGNDINTASGISLLYDTFKLEANPATKLAVLESFDEVLGIGIKEMESGRVTQEVESVDEDLLAYINEKIEERKEAKKAKDFTKADAIRDELRAKGIEIKDTREGVVWKRI